MLEKELEKKLRDKVKKLGGKAYKFVSPGNAGVMDRIVLMPGGIIYFVEMKRPGGKLSKLQIVQKRTIEKLGFNVLIISSEQELNDFISSVRNGGGTK